MAIILIFALVLFGFAVVMVAKAVSAGRTAPQGLQTIAGYGFGAPVDTNEDSGGTAVRSLADRVGVLAERRTSAGSALRQKLIAAGMYETPAARFMGYQILLAIGIP